ncbi:MAG: hypothetical protein KF779_14765 [Hyphomonadaceae bacterium]|nr:hypothetical protein [Hyphomonadaceae bacterium]
MRKPTGMLSKVTSLTLAMLLASCALPGSIDHGRRFGVEVGMPLEEADAILSRTRAHRELGDFPDGAPMCGGRPRGNGERVETYATPQHDVVCLFVVSGRVVAIAWETPFM